MTLTCTGQFWVRGPIAFALRESLREFAGYLDPLRGALQLETEPCKFIKPLLNYKKVTPKSKRQFSSLPAGL